MTEARFLNIIGYSPPCPDDVSPARWAGMLKWYTTRTKEGYFDETATEERQSDNATT